MTEDQIGVVVNFYAKPGVAAVDVVKGTIKKGDLLKYKGSTTDFTEEVTRIEIENQPVEEAKAGDLVGMKVSAKVRKNDKVYKVVE
jgi:translation initiation factor IF-2